MGQEGTRGVALVPQWGMPECRPPAPAGGTRALWPPSPLARTRAHLRGRRARFALAGPARLPAVFWPSSPFPGSGGTGLGPRAGHPRRAGASIPRARAPAQPASPPASRQIRPEIPGLPSRAPASTRASVRAPATLRNGGTGVPCCPSLPVLPCLRGGCSGHVPRVPRPVLPRGTDVSGDDTGAPETPARRCLLPERRNKK